MVTVSFPGIVNAFTILKKVNDWKIGTIDYDSMLKVFPFEIKGELIK